MSEYPAVQAGQPGPTGLGRRNRRLSDRETRQRMLQAAREMIHRSGLTVSLDHISFEDVIRDADVSRSTAYRHWPHKDLFFSDLVTELAGAVSPAILRDEIRLVEEVLAEHLDELRTPQLRHGVILELIRHLALLDFRSVLASPDWRTYLALHATISSLVDGEVRDRVQAALARSEAAHTARVARAWEQLAAVFGYRLRVADSSFDTLATLLSATMRGLVITALSAPDVATRTTTGRLFGADHEEQWSLAAIGLAGIAMAFLEPDPDFSWDDDRLADLRRTLESWKASGP